MAFGRAFLAQVLVICAINKFISFSVMSSSLPGGLTKAPTNSFQVVQPAFFATQVFNGYISREANAYKILKILSAQTQVVAGINYYLDVELVRTRCRKTVPGWLLQSCPLDGSQKTLHCIFVVYDIPWQHTMRLTTLKCLPINKS
ncbi:cystatin-like [Hoplias malabaricus]|uniref:cystatin-like n=1 Tax=Hoplias malabaricus TaxID=27720 RepID=UPI003463717A